MSCVVGIISEYNPFHNGHKYQIEQIRKELPDSTIVAIMSGNIVQRGEFAMLDKYFRARVALECGVNAVFELPYPYCGSTAEVFANAGVEIAYKLGCDYLYFGTEQQSLEHIEKIADIIDSDEFERVLKEQIANNAGVFLSAKNKALEKFGFTLPSSSNDILALEYIRAIKKKKISLEYRTVKRTGAGYKDDGVCEIMSASAIRKYYAEKERFLSVPLPDLYTNETNLGYVLDYRCANRLLHMHVLHNGDNIDEVFDSNEEIEGIIKALASKNNSQSFFEKLSSKSYTTSRMKRVILYSLFGVENVDFTPKFTFLLGMDEKGRQVINRVKKSESFSVITKHSEVKRLDGENAEIAEKRYRIDALYNTLLVSQKTPDTAYKMKPILADKK